jgi:hypothetical protein
VGRTRRRAGRTTCFGTTTARGAARCRADVGRIHPVGAGADFTRGTDMGRRSAAASCRPCACAIVGSVSARSAARANMGLVLARAERLRAASCTVMGGA